MTRAAIPLVYVETDMSAGETLTDYRRRTHPPRSTIRTRARRILRAALHIHA